jgi:hypothetical protein
MQTMPVDLAFYTQRLSTITAQAKANLGIHIFAEPSNDQVNELVAEIIRLSEEDRQSRSEEPEHTMRRAYDFGVSQVKRLNQRQVAGGEIDTHRFVVGGIDAIFAAMITASYAAFETLAFDLWVQAVNKFPALAAQWATKGDNEKKNITLADLASRNFDLSSQMGDFLNQKRKVSFQSLNDIKTNYQHAFGDTVLACFEPWSSIFVASKIRHLLAHRGGQVDRKFIDEMKDHPKYADLPVNSDIHFTGSDIREHVMASLSCGVRLFKFVDDWSFEHEERKTTE